MKNILQLLFRTIVILAFVGLMTALVYYAIGGRDKQGLSDWLVYASFITLAMGTIAGITNFGYKGPRDTPDLAEESETFQRTLREFFRSGPFGISFTLAGVLCFGLAVLVDVLF